MKNETLAQINMMLIFLIANLAALLLYPIYGIYEGSLGEEGDNPWIAVYYLIYIVAVTLIIVFIAKKGKKNLLRGIFYFAIAWAMWYALFPIFLLIIPPYSDLLSLSLAVVITLVMIKYPEWYVINAVGILVTMGIALIFGMALSLIPIILLLSLFAIYDAIAVYMSKHMVYLADSAIENKLPALFVLPAKKDYSFRKVQRKKEKGDKGEREAYYMGYGDVLIPGILVIAAERSFGMLGGIFTLLGALVAMVLLMVMVNSGKPQPGLPYLNAGALAGLLVYLLLQFPL
jgi:presenilin-like A22 family membrane protease